MCELEVLSEALLDLGPLRLTKNSNLLAESVGPLGVALLVQRALLNGWTAHFVVFVRFCDVSHQINHRVCAYYVPARHLRAVGKGIVQGYHVRLKCQLKASCHLTQRDLVLGHAQGFRRC